jgi:polyisoprenyl-phosphate glycosyltransferase
MIPTYNEEENVTIIYKELTNVLHSLNRDYEIIFVDDGSYDKTLQKLLDLYTCDTLVKIIKFRKNF